MRLIITVLFIGCSCAVFSQNFTIGLFPELAVSLPLAKDVTYKSKAENFFPAYTNSNWNVEHKNSDFQHFVAIDLNPYWSVAGGYQFRIAEKQSRHHRVIQQISYVRRMNSRIAHRLRTDQTFSAYEKTEVRLRYRISFEQPLQGVRLEKGESYLVLSDEVLGSLQSNQEDVENRVDVSLGKYLLNDHKAETGFSYRTSRYLTEGFTHQLWFQLGYYFN